MSKKKIAVLIDWYLPGTKAGGPVRSVYSLLQLLKNDFEFYLITTNQDLGSTNCYEAITPDTFVTKEEVHYYYFSKNKLDQKTILQVLNTIEPDLVYTNSFWSFPFSISIVHLKKKNLIKAPVLLAPRGMLGKGALGLKSFKKQLFLFFAKTLGWYDHIIFHATQHQEEADILSKFRSARICVAPNINEAAVIENRSQKTAGHLKLFFLSRVAQVKNLHMALELLRTIPSEYTISYAIFGNIESQDYWQECQNLIKQLPQNVSVVYKGELPFHAVQETIREYQFLFLPTLNENFGHSIVESLLCGCPAIISDQTPWNDLEKNGAGFAIALHDKQRFTEALIRSARLNQEEFQKTSLSASDYIRKKIDVPAIHQHYKTLFNDCIKN